MEYLIGARPSWPKPRALPHFPRAYATGALLLHDAVYAMTWAYGPLRTLEMLRDSCPLD